MCGLERAARVAGSPPAPAWPGPACPALPPASACRCAGAGAARCHQRRRRFRCRRVPSTPPPARRRRPQVEQTIGALQQLQAGAQQLYTVSGTLANNSDSEPWLAARLAGRVPACLGPRAALLPCWLALPARTPPPTHHHHRHHHHRHHRRHCHITTTALPLPTPPSPPCLHPRRGAGSGGSG